MKHKNSLYFLATEEHESQNRNNFKDLVADYIDSSPLKSASLDNWDAIFKALVGHTSSQKKVIVIDEFQYLG